MTERHGMHGTPTYNTWKNLKPRCSSWDSFLIFLKDVGERPLGMQLIRLDTTREYSPTNCRWAHRKGIYETVSGTRTHNTWHAMMQRCYYKDGATYKYYGAKGVIVCDRWHDFACFMSDMGERPNGMTLDRFPDKNGNYEKSNCRWATPRQQRENQSSRVIPLTLDGKTMLLTDWAKSLDIDQSALYARIFYLGWSLRDALTLKPHHDNRYRKLSP